MSKSLKYKEYIELFKEISNKKGKPLKYAELTNNKYGLPSARWFISHCPNKTVHNYNDFISWLGYINKYNINKKEATRIIYHMQSKLNRPLLYDDFRNPQKGEIGIGAINRI